MAMLAEFVGGSITLPISNTIIGSNISIGKTISKKRTSKIEHPKCTKLEEIVKHEICTNLKFK